MTIARRTEKYIATKKHGKKLLRKETKQLIEEALQGARR